MFVAEGDSMHLDLIRNIANSDGTGTFGSLSIDGELFCATCEQPWNDNRGDISCIPEGDYRLLPYDSPAHGPTVVFHNPELGIYGTPSMVPAGKVARTLCEIHTANWPFQLRGCVAVGSQVMVIPPNGRGVCSSIATFKRLTCPNGRG